MMYDSWEDFHDSNAKNDDFLDKQTKEEAWQGMLEAFVNGQIFNDTRDIEEEIPQDILDKFFKIYVDKNEIYLTDM